MSDPMNKVDLCLSLGCYTNAVATVKPILNQNKRLSEQEREIFRKVYKELVNNLRSNRNQIDQIVEDEKEKIGIREAGRSLKKDIDLEIKKASEEVLRYLGNINKLFSRNFNTTEKVFYKKLEADFKHFIIETIPEKDRSARIEECGKLYKEAVEVAENNLKVYDGLRLAVVLTHGHFAQEVSTDDQLKRETLEKISKTFNDCLQEFDKLDEDKFVEIVQTLSDMRDLTTLKKNLDENL